MSNEALKDTLKLLKQQNKDSAEKEKLEKDIKEEQNKLKFKKTKKFLNSMVEVYKNSKRIKFK